MKKMMLSALVLSMSVGLNAAVELFTVDGIKLMEQSKAGRELTEKARNAKAEVEAFIMSKNKELAKLQEEMTSKAQLLSKEALDEKAASFEKERRKSELAVVEKREAVSHSLQKEHTKFRDEQTTVISSLCQRNGWSALLEKSAALFVSQSLDKTNEVLQALDEAYDARVAAAAQVTKETTKKTAAPKKKEIKTA